MFNENSMSSAVILELSENLASLWILNSTHVLALLVFISEAIPG